MATERPAAFALASLPRELIVVVEDEWKDRIEHGHTIALGGFIKVPQDQVPRFERLSGQGGIFLRCIKRHRVNNEEAPPTVSWVPQQFGEAGPAYLARVQSMACGNCQGLIRRQ
eukprot:7487092-Alexandrium_andersonii.AAC.1